MKKLFLLSVYSLLLGHLFAQDSILKTANEKSKWALNFLFSRDYDYRYAHKIANPPINNSGIGYKTSDQIPKMGWHASVIIIYRIVKHFDIQTGLIFDNKGYNTNSFINYAQIDKYGNIISYENGSYKMNYYLIGIPVLFNGIIPLTKKIYGALGMGFNFCLGGGELIPSGAAYTQQRTGQNGGIGITTKFGLEYYSKHNLILCLKPTCSYFFNSFRDPATVDTEYYKLHLYSYGVEFGIGFGLGKKK